MNNIWNDFEIKEFTFEDRNARIIFPKKANEGKNWTLKTEYRTKSSKDLCMLQLSAGVEN